MLPLKKVVLYKHGVGYFERAGEVQGDAVLELHFKATEMNDVLKSLTTLDLDGGHFASVSYDSKKPVDKQLEDITLRLDDTNALTCLLRQVKGAQIEIEVGGRKVQGTVTGLETVTRPHEEVVYPATQLALFLEGGAIQTFDLAEVKTIHLLDASLRRDLQHLLDILIGAQKKDLKRLAIFARGTGKRRVIASYLVETPVWKTSYRALLRSDDKPILQGWALVDNTQDEDWLEVQLSLVAGLPISFVHDLYNPRFRQRPVVEVEEEAAYAPPQMQAVVRLAEQAEFEVASAGAARADREARHAVELSAATSARIHAARERSVMVQTRTVEIGDLFHYEIKNPVTVKRNQSALVPILQEAFAGKRVAVYNPDIRDKNPMSAILFKNTTGMTLEGGPMTVLEDGTYAGESMLDTMKVDEERLVPFSVELGCTVTVDHRSELQNVHLCRIEGGILHLHRYRLRKRIYTIASKIEKKLDLFLEHRFNPGWELVDTTSPVATTESFYRFRFDVAPKQTLTFAVTEKGDEAEAFQVGGMTPGQLRVFIEMKYVDKVTAAALRGILAQQEKSSLLQVQVQQLEKEMQAIFKDQERLRANLEALGTSSSETQLRERYIAQLAAEEDRLAACRQETKRHEDEKTAVDEALRRQIKELEFEQEVK